MATTLNVSSLPDYVEQHRDELLVKSTIGAKTLDYVEIMPNVKYKDALNYLDTDIALRAASCEWAPDGAVNFNQAYIEVKAVESQLEICWLDFQKKYMNYQLNFEAGRETLPFEEKIADSLVESAKEAVEELVWLGNSGLGITGFIADAETASAATVDFASGMTAVGKVDAIVAALPARMIKKGTNIFMSYSDFNAYVMEANSTCCAGRPTADGASESLNYYGNSKVKLIPVLGLENAGGLMMASTSDALVYGTDIEGSETTFEVWYSKDDKKFKFQLLFNAGTAIKWPDEVIVGKAA